MKYTTLPNTDTKVSKICLGTMTFGQQNTESEGHSQLDFAFEKGINFIDTAEMYSVPARQETYGSTEKIIGTWFKKSGKRDEVILATKIAGPNPLFTYMRDKNDFSPASIKFALDQSLKRLQTDYIDLYQLHFLFIDQKSLVLQLLVDQKIFHNFSAYFLKLFSIMAKSTPLFINLVKHTLQ